MTWKYFHGNCNDTPTPLTDLPEAPPWRQFLAPEQVDSEIDRQYWHRLRALAGSDPRSVHRGKSFRIQLQEEPWLRLVDAVNAAIHLRRPLLVTGVPGSGKTTLAYAIAYELQLGPVLTWSITPKANLIDAEYRYDALARLQDTQRRQSYSPIPGAALDRSRPSSPLPPEEDLGDYIQLGSVGTAFVPSRLPRVLLIDEIDKSDLNLPNDLLNLFEEGEFEIPELARQKRRRRSATAGSGAGLDGLTPETDQPVLVRTTDPDLEVPITNGRVKCCQFPIVIMTSNGERDFPPAFYRRCLRVTMPKPNKESLLCAIEAHFSQTDLAKSDRAKWTQTEEDLKKVIDRFLDRGNKADRATDQLLNAIYLRTRQEAPSQEDMERLQTLLLKPLSESDS